MIDYEARYRSSDLPLPALDRLMAAHPKLFRGERPMCWSDFPEGWYELIHEVCCGIESLLSDEELAQFEVRQIKQKLGSLRLYYRFDREKPQRASDLEDAGSNFRSVLPCLRSLRCMRAARRQRELGHGAVNRLYAILLPRCMGNKTDEDSTKRALLPCAPD